MRRISLAWQCNSKTPFISSFSHDKIGVMLACPKAAFLKIEIQPLVSYHRKVSGSRNRRERQRPVLWLACAVTAVVMWVRSKYDTGGEYTDATCHCCIGSRERTSVVLLQECKDSQKACPRLREVSPAHNKKHGHATGSPLPSLHILH